MSAAETNSVPVPAAPEALRLPVHVSLPANHLQRYSQEYNTDNNNTTMSPINNSNVGRLNAGYKVDANKNTIITLDSIGLNAVVRFKRYEDEPRFCPVDLTMGVTGLDNNNAGTLVKSVHTNCLNSVEFL